MTAAPAPQKESRNDNFTLNRIKLLLSIFVPVLIGAFWLFSVQATANNALDASEKNAQKIDTKADRDEVEKHFQSIENKLDQINNFLLNQKR